MRRREERIGEFNANLRLALDAKQAAMWTALPAIVTSVNLDAQTIAAQPAIRGEITAQDGSTTTVSLPLLVDVPLVWPRAGGFALTFPVTAGDEVLVIFASRCIDAWWQSGGVGVALEKRMHDLSDGFAILGPTSQPKKLSNVSAQNVQLRDSGGTTLLEITPSGAARVVGANTVDIVAPEINLTATTAMTLMAQEITLAGEVTIEGDMTQSSGNFVSSGGVDFDTHRHTDVQTGPDESGGPTS